MPQELRRPGMGAMMRMTREKREKPRTIVPLVERRRIHLCRRLSCQVPQQQVGRKPQEGGRWAGSFHDRCMGECRRDPTMRGRAGRRCARAGRDFGIDRSEACADTLRCILAFHLNAAGFSHAGVASMPRGEAEEGIRKGFGFRPCRQRARSSVSDKVRQPSDRCRDAGRAAGQGFQREVRVVVLARRDAGDIRGRQDVGQSGVIHDLPEVEQFEARARDGG